MPGFNGTGPRGMGPMTGGGRGFCGPRGAETGLRRYGFPRRAPYADPYYSPYGAVSFAPQMTREQELELLKSEAQAMRGQLEQIEARIQRLGSDKE